MFFHVVLTFVFRLCESDITETCLKYQGCMFYTHLRRIGRRKKKLFHAVVLHKKDMHLLGIGYDCMHTTHEWKFGIIFFYSKLKYSKN